MTTYVCTCGKKYDHQVKCCGQWTHIICEKRGCEKPATKTIYALGYLASVCEDHYNAASQQDKADAIRFRYAEG